jgi:hypothetical protein
MNTKTTRPKTQKQGVEQWQRDLNKALYDAFSERMKQQGKSGADALEIRCLERTQKALQRLEDGQAKTARRLHSCRFKG